MHKRDRDRREQAVRPGSAGDGSRRRRWMKAAAAVPVAIALASLAGRPGGGAGTWFALPMEQLAASAAVLVLAVVAGVAVSRLGDPSTARLSVWSAAGVVAGAGLVCLAAEAGVGGGWFLAFADTVVSTRAAGAAGFSGLLLVLAGIGLATLRPIWFRRPFVRGMGRLVIILGAALSAVVVLAYVTGWARGPRDLLLPLTSLEATAFAGLFVLLAIANGIQDSIRRLFVGRAPETRLSDRERLMLIGIAGALLLAIWAVGLALLISEREQRRERVAAELTDVATLKVRQLADWREEHLSDALVMARTPRLDAIVGQLAAGTIDLELRGQLLEWLRSMAASQGFESVLLLDAQSRVMLSYPTQLSSGQPTVNTTPAIAGLRDPVWMDLHVSRRGAVHADLLVPLGGADRGKAVGAILVRVDPERSLYPLLRTWPVRRGTAETVLYRRHGDEVVQLSGSRFSPNGALKLRCRIDDPRMLVAHVARGETGLIENVIGFRGVPLVGVGFMVPGSPWFVVAKMDAAEAFGSYRRVAIVIILITALSQCATALGVAVLWRHRARDIVRREFEAKRARHAVAERLAAVMQQANDIIFVIDMEGHILEANDYACAAYGYSVAEFRALPPGGLRPARFQDEWKQQFDLVTMEGRGVFEVVHRRKNGSEFVVEASGRIFESGGVRYRLGILRDVSERKAHEQQINRLNGLLAALSRVNQTIVHAKSRDQLFAPICRALVESGSFSMVWIGVRESEADALVPVASFGDVKGYLDAPRILVGDGPGEGPVQAAMVEGRTCVCHDLTGDDGAVAWKKRALAHGFEAVVSLPVRSRGGVIGTLVGFASRKNCFTLQEIALLEEAADDLSFALDNLEATIERKQAAESLRVAHERLRRFVDSNIIGVLVADMDGRVVEANDYYLRMIGFSRDEFNAGKINWREITPPEWLPSDERAILELRKTGTCIPYEKEYLRRDGVRVPVYLVDALLPGPGEHIAAFALDLTERVAAERRIFDELQFNETLIASLPIGVVVWKETGECIAANDAVARIIGTTKQTILGQNFRTLESWKRSGMLDAANAALDLGTEQQLEAEVMSTFGTHLWLSSRFVPFTYSGRHHLLVIVMDVSGHRRAEQRIREQADLIDNANEAIVVSDLENRVTFWSRGAERLFGWSAAEVAGRLLKEFVALDSLGGDANTGNALSLSADWRGELRVFDRRGQLLFIETSITVVRDENGRPKGRVSISTDVTEKKRLAEQFLRAQRLESIGMLAAGIAHDLNNVLAPVSMAAPLLRMHATSPVDLRLLEALEKCAQRGASLVRQILGFSHGVSGEPRPVEVQHILRDIGEVVVETFPKSISLHEDISGELLPILGNPTQIHQVLLNLVVNARDAMPHGGDLRIVARNCTAGDMEAQLPDEGRSGAWVLLEVGDTGTGIAPDVLPRIWEPFFTTKSAERGTGLGLSTVRGIIEQHHGFVTLDTVPGRGTTFRVYLPASEPANVSSTGVRQPVSRLGRGETILLVDDEEPIRDSASAILTCAGYRVVVAANGADAIEVFSRNPSGFSLVITDRDMPVMDGDALVAAIYAQDPEMKILVVSGLANPLGDASQKTSADAFLAKPFTIETLLTAVDELLKGRNDCGVGNAD